MLKVAADAAAKLVKISYKNWVSPGLNKPIPDFEEAIKAKDFFSSIPAIDHKERGDVDKAFKDLDLQVVTGSMRLPGLRMKNLPKNDNKIIQNLKKTIFKFKLKANITFSWNSITLMLGSKMSRSKSSLDHKLWTRSNELLLML